MLLPLSWFPEGFCACYSFGFVVRVFDLLPVWIMILDCLNKAAFGSSPQVSEQFVTP